MVNAIKEKIKAYMAENHNIKLDENDYDIMEIYNVPLYKLYELEIEQVKENGQRIDFEIRVSDFFNKKDYQIVRTSVLASSMNKSSAKRIIRSGENVKIIVNRYPVQIVTRGKVIRSDQFPVVAMTEFGKKLKCRVAGEGVLEVIE